MSTQKKHRVPTFILTLILTSTSIVLQQGLLPSCIFAESTALGLSPLSQFENDWAEILRDVINRSGGVHYRKLKESPKLAKLLEHAAKISLSPLTELERKAFYINLYNAAMMAHLLAYCEQKGIDLQGSNFLELEINSIRIPGGNIWNGDPKAPYGIALEGQRWTLDDIEHGLIRGQVDEERFKKWRLRTLDPRIHAAVNCAAVSCPKIREKPYSATTVEAMLDENMRAFVGSDSYFAPTEKNNAQMQANEIVYWYYSDFDEFGKAAGKGGAGGYLAQFLDPVDPGHRWKKEHFEKHFNDKSKFSLKLSSAFKFSYDWRPNDQRNK